MRVLLILVALTGIAGLPADIPVQAQSDPNAGNVRPLSEVLDKVKAEVPGHVLDVQLDKGKQPWTYQIRIRSDKGNVVLVVVDAESGRILSTRGNR